MGVPILVYGKSGSGKSRSMKNFGEDEICLINVLGKKPPFKTKFKYSYVSTDVNKIANCLMKMPTKIAIIDDCGYIQTEMFMNGHSNPNSGTSTFDLYNKIGDSMWRLIRLVADNLPEDVHVYFMFHEQTSDIGECKIRTIGKLLDEKICLEGMVTIAFHCMTDGNRHWFSTQSNGFDIAKSPEDMFEKEIDNDLKMVDNRIREFYSE